MHEHPDYRHISAARRQRDRALREKRVRCEVITIHGRRCTSNGDPTFGRVLCWVHRQAHQSGRRLELATDAGATLRVLLDPGAVDIARGQR